MAAKKLKPAELAIARFGSVRKLGKAIGMTETAPGHWVSRGDGSIPQRQQPKVIEAAKRLKITFTAEEAIHGGYVEA